MCLLALFRGVSKLVVVRFASKQRSRSGSFRPDCHYKLPDELVYSKQVRRVHIAVVYIACRLDRVDIVLCYQGAARMGDIRNPARMVSDITRRFVSLVVMPGSQPNSSAWMTRGRS